MYNIMAKVLTNRLKLIIGSVLSETQYVFVKERQILNGIVIANEVVDYAERRKKELISFKVDFEKPYNLVEWVYFSCKRRMWLMECKFSTAMRRFWLMEILHEFKLGMGLRQGDPLSALLFLITDEGSNVMLKASVKAGIFGRKLSVKQLLPQIIRAIGVYLVISTQKQGIYFSIKSYTIQVCLRTLRHEVENEG
jgi:hypothetical protein